MPIALSARGTLVKFHYARGHGSVWGDQFRIEVCPTQIIQAFYFPERRGQPVEREQVPITQEQWLQLEAAVNALFPLLRKKRRQRSFQVDGTRFRNLTLTRQQWGRQRQYRYTCPDCPETNQLETLLQAMIKEKR